MGVLNYLVEIRVLKESHLKSNHAPHTIDKQVARSPPAEVCSTRSRNSLTLLILIKSSLFVPLHGGTSDKILLLECAV